MWKLQTPTTFLALLLTALLSFSCSSDSGDDPDDDTKKPDASLSAGIDADVAVCVGEGDGCDFQDLCCRGSCESNRCQCQSAGLCDGDTDCCVDYACSSGECRGEDGTSCDGNLDCIVGLVCHQDTRECGVCKPSGTACTSNLECCDSLAGCGFDNECR